MNDRPGSDSGLSIPALTTPPVPVPQSGSPSGRLLPPGLSSNEPWYQRHLWQIQPVRDLLMALAVLLLFYGGYLLSPVTVPFMVALGFAYLFEPLIVRITRMLPWLHRRIVVLSLLALIIAGMGFAIAVIVPVVGKQTQQLRANTPMYVHSLRKMVSENSLLPDWARSTAQSVLDTIKGPDHGDAGTGGDVGAASFGTDTPLTEARVREIIRDEMVRQNSLAKSEWSGYATRGLQALAFLAQLAGTTAQVLFFVGVSALCFLYLSSSFPQIKEYGRTLLPVSNREWTLKLIRRMDDTISAFVRGRMLISFILTAIYMIGWTIIGVPHAVLLGLLAGLCSFVPYLAWISVPAAWMLLAVWLTGEPSHTAFYFAAPADGGAILWWKVLCFPVLVVLGAQFTEDYALTPAIQGQATNLHPLTITLAVISGGVLAGLYGMLLAIPTAACLKILLDEVVMPKLRAWLQGRRRDPFPV